MSGTLGYIITAVISFIVGISVNVFRRKGDITKFSLDQLIAEMKRRGFYLNIGTLNRFEKR